MCIENERMLLKVEKNMFPDINLVNVKQLIVLIKSKHECIIVVRKWRQTFKLHWKYWSVYVGSTIEVQN